jgi:hypothetical protein
MSLRFRLQESVAGGRYRGVSAPGLGVWRKSRPYVGVFAYRQRVRALAPGSAYRVVVAYRWHDATGQVIESKHRRSKPCRQTGPLPNLRLQRIGGKPVLGSPGRTTYSINVINSGVVPAPASEVRLAVNGSDVGTAMVPALMPKQITHVFVEGPTCTSGVSAEADSGDVVRETSEVDNERAAACPAS